MSRDTQWCQEEDLHDPHTWTDKHEYDFDCDGVNPNAALNAELDAVRARDLDAEYRREEARRLNEEINRLTAEVATVNEALNNATDLLDEARTERDEALAERDKARSQFEALILSADRALAKRDNAREEVERLRHYTSTACHHGLHFECGKAQHDRGEDGAPHCKFCPEPCRCACHGEVA